MLKRSAAGEALPRPTRAAIVARLASAQKSNRGAPPYSRWVNRPLGRQLAAIAYLRHLTPNAVSLISALFTYAAIAAIALVRPSADAAIAITASLVIGYALDSADGQVARLRGGGSMAGEWLDHVLDAGKLATFHLAVAIAWFRFFHLGGAAFLLIPLGFSAVACVFFFALILTDMLRRVADAKAGGDALPKATIDARESAPVLRSLIVLPNDYGVLCLVMLLMPLHVTFIAVYTAMFAANVVFLAAGSLRWFREMSRLSRIPSPPASVPQTPRW